jgi:glucose/arabinose dehydrogenase
MRNLRHSMMAALLCASAYVARADIAGLERVTAGAGILTVMARAPGQPDRLYVGTRDGVIKILDLKSSTILNTPFLTIPNVDTEQEGSLLGLAFHPDYATNGKFYVNVTIDNGGIPVDESTVSPYSIHVREYTVSADANIANASFKEVLEIVKPAASHNGGWIDFGPNDGYLYMTVGDGGCCIDSGVGHTPGVGNAQDLTDNPFGKVLRLDVDHDAFPMDTERNYAIPATNPYVGAEGDDEIWASGLRNPWRASFDRVTGDLWIGDVGEAWREEINFQPYDSGGGENYGWRLREGAVATPSGQGGGDPPPGNVDPVYDYLHLGRPGDLSLQGNSVTGGYVYRGPDPEVRGLYFFTDYISRQVWTFDPKDPYGAIENITALLTASTGPLTSGVTTFGEDADGNIYMASAGGQIYRLVTDALTPGDYNADGDVDGTDLAAWGDGFGMPDGAQLADGDGDGDVDGLDFLLWQRNLGASPFEISESAVATIPEPSSISLAIVSAVYCAACRSSRRVASTNHGDVHGSLKIFAIIVRRW